ncbi:hypothetical protein FACS1894105_01020 [Clostridia bacterium]|nr:hypothetical protein FACS1894105_01020 [Clostridia bacterium]GHV13566.1 hypothetical protein FACS1894219_08580 [Clostridia bacterium]
MSNRIFQGMLNQYKDIVYGELGIIDDSGLIVASTVPDKIGMSLHDIYQEVIEYGNISVYERDGFIYKIIESDSDAEYLLYYEGMGGESEKMMSVIAVAVSNVRTLCGEQFDKASFIKNVILDNILPGDIYQRARELEFAEDVERVVYLIKFPIHIEYNPHEIIQNMFPDKSHDFVVSLDEKDIVLIREIDYDEFPHKGDISDLIDEVAKTISDTVSSEFYIKVSVGIGSPIDDIKDLSRAFKEAQIALEVGKVFDTEKDIINYKNLGIGRIIYQLPTTLCEVFLQEVFKYGSLESLDRESLMTIQSFFENNLNVSETSRKMFVHRNTLVYRLEKIKKLTGLDLREFEHAIVFKVALMVKKYLSSRPVKY